MFVAAVSRSEAATLNCTPPPPRLKLPQWFEFGSGFSWRKEADGLEDSRQR